MQDYQKKIAEYAKQRYEEDQSFVSRQYPTYRLFEGRIRYLFSAISIVTGVMYVLGVISISLPTLLALPIALILIMFIEKMKYVMTPKFMKNLLQGRILNALSFFIILFVLYGASIYFSVSFIQDWMSQRDQTLASTEQEVEGTLDSIRNRYDSIIVKTNEQLQTENVKLSDIVNQQSNLSSRQQQQLTDANDRLQKLTNEKYYYLRKAETDSTLNRSALEQRYNTLIASQEQAVNALMRTSGAGNNYAIENTQRNIDRYDQQLRRYQQERSQTLDSVSQYLLVNIDKVKAEQQSNFWNITLISYFVELMILLSLLYIEWFYWRLQKEPIIEEAAVAPLAKSKNQHVINRQSYL